MQKIKAVAYARYSSDKQQESSIVVQLGAIRRFCEAHNIELVHEYIDEAQSGTNANRHDFQEMVKDAPFREFQFVIVHRMDRWARNVDDARYYKKYFARFDIKVISAVEEFDETPEGEFFELMSMGMAELYSKKLARESAAGKLANAREGKAHGGTPPLGYKVVKKRYVIDEPYAEIVRIMFAMCRERKSYVEIRDYLNSHGYRRPDGRKFGINMHDLFRNRKYIGEYVYNRSDSKDMYGRRNNHREKSEAEIIRIPNGMPQIIDLKTFFEVQKILDDRKDRANAPLVKDRSYLMSGLMKCNGCGAAIVGEMVSTHQGKFKYGVYRCNQKNTKCHVKPIRTEYLDEYIIGLFEKCLLHGRCFEQFYKVILEKYDEAYEQLKTRIKANEDIISGLKTEIEQDKEHIGREDSRTMKLYALNNIAEINAKVRDIEFENEIIMEDIANFPEIDKKLVKRSIAGYRSQFSKRDFESMRGVLMTLIDHVLIDNEKLRITLNLNRLLESESTIHMTIIVERDMVALRQNHDKLTYAFSELNIE